MGIYRENFTVRYSEVDRNNEITPISIMQYFQEIGCLHSDYMNMGLKQDTAWIIVHWKVKIISKVTWNDTIMVRTWPSGIRGPYCMRDYEMYQGEKLIAVGTSKWVLTDRKTHKLLKITADVAEKFKVVNKQAISQPVEKLEPIPKSSVKLEHIVDIRDLDTNQHMNNIKYIELAYNMLPKDINYIEVVYKHASVLGDKLTCYYNDYNVTIKNGESVSAILKFKE